MMLKDVAEAGRGRWSLPAQFLFAGGFVMTTAMLAVGSWVSMRIEQGVVQSSATAAAGYVENFIAPLGDQLAGTGTLEEPVQRKLEEVFTLPALAEQVVSYKLWHPDGLIVMASDSAIVGQRFEEADDLQRAWTGEVAASYQELNDDEDAREAELGIPLLEVYSPVHAFYSGDVVAVVEFYHNGTVLAADLANARRASWLVVGSAFLASGLLLFGIVQAGGRTIDRQRRLLEMRLTETRTMSAQNDELRRRAVSASARATAQTEKAIRQLGADLHDGPAQNLALAALRLDALLPEAEKGSNEAFAVRSALDQALSEIRGISRGLAIPDLDSIGLADAIERAVQEHRLKAGTEVKLEGVLPFGTGFDYARKLCAFRFLQETLSNAARHGGGAATVRVAMQPQAVTITVSDSGRGFDPSSALRLRDDGGQGLLGLVDRAESLGGSLTIQSAPGTGTTITLTLPREDRTA
ncbi:sensor histidine kinase [Sinisalibacter aestuarii]|uniref:Oxygen sensor histidine kinase NreB n=1 Tax=Sinisalibacter aestuarii TaxID=2949426 RepID=A0ABQ5LW89_9RHOB|nr:ATP-binding protein [Sinisalibacter aestuarii]GKY89247.1 histidine kinase [Sinisalibacter aestuarii]